MHWFGVWTQQQDDPLRALALHAALGPPTFRPLPLPMPLQLLLNFSKDVSEAARPQTPTHCFAAGGAQLLIRAPSCLANPTPSSPLQLLFFAHADPVANPPPLQLLFNFSKDVS